MPNLVKLVRESGGMGDILCMDAPAEQVKHEDPDTQIVAYIPNDFTEILLHCKAIDGVVGIGTVPVLSKIRRQANAPINPVTHPYLAPVFRGIPGRVVDLYCPARPYEETCPGPLKFGRPELFCIAAGCHSASHAKPVWVVRPHEHKMASDFFRDHLQSPRATIGFAPRASGSERAYPFTPGYMPELLKWLASKYDVLYLDCAAPPIPLPDRVFPVFAPTPIFAAILTFCRTLIAVDSFPLHLAAALDVPAIGLFGPTQAESTCATYPKAKHISGTSVDCPIPCHYSWRKNWRGRDGPNSCAQVNCKRMMSLTSERIIPILETLL